ncbi:hypothetical protein ACFPES_01660 [Paenibacillus sp. GCM10023248]|uniref:hypothetical protein n=1 Tax=unclassified Paenibacillus TaxID=185978 RepID=UPI0023799C40|nr:hypothetical protein [Paenibacillus sp. MAHUQ-63]MDD9265729.1 hypothetical protein [Paenibacillus sp. MAHUQ-63]
MKNSHEFVTKKSVESLTEKLQLPVEREYQDWEVEIANSSRLSEFVMFYESAKLNDEEKFALMSLIIASFDDALSEGNVPDGIWDKIRGLLRSNFDLHGKTILYWSLVDEELDDCFSVTQYMRELIVY